MGKSLYDVADKYLRFYDRESKKLDKEVRRIESEIKKEESIQKTVNDRLNKMNRK